MNDHPMLDFEILPGPYTLKKSAWIGVAGCFSEEGLVAVIMCPNASQLEKVWARISDEPLIIERCAMVAGMFENGKIQGVTQVPYSPDQIKPERTTRRKAPVAEGAMGVDLPWDEDPKPMYYSAYGAEGVEGFDGPNPDLKDLLAGAPPFDEKPAFIFEVENPHKDSQAIYRWHRGRSTWVKL